MSSNAWRGGPRRALPRREATIPPTPPTWPRPTPISSTRFMRRETCNDRIRMLVVMHPFTYEGLRVVVTGGASGVGAALLDVLAEFDAAHVTVLDVKRPTGPHHAYVAIDLGDEQAVRGAGAQIDGPVHVLF